MNKLVLSRILGHLSSLFLGIYPGIIPKNKEEICSKYATPILTNIGERSLSFITCIVLALSVNAQVIEIDDVWDIKYNNRPIVIEGYASWCAPCHQYAPIFAQLAKEYAGRVDFYKIDVENEDCEDFVVRYNVNSVPVTVFLWDPKGDATVKSNVEFGLLNKSELRHYIEDAISRQYKY